VTPSHRGPSAIAGFLVHIAALRITVVKKNLSGFFTTHGSQLITRLKPGAERIQALADVLRSALCCHSNETHAPVANPDNSAQLEGTPTIPPSYIRVHAVV